MPSRCRCAHIFNDPYSDSGVHRPCTHRPRMEGSRGDRHTVLREHAADRSDPETVPVISDERTDLRCGQRRERGSLSRTKKDVAALRISIVGLFEFGVAAPQRPNLRSSLAGNPVTLPVIDLPLTDPVPQRLGVHPQPFGHRRDRRPLTRIVIAVLQHQTDSLGPRLRVVLARHDMHLPKKGGAHQTRDGSRMRSAVHESQAGDTTSQRGVGVGSDRRTSRFSG
jgi:hypothetical protein